MSPFIFIFILCIYIGLSDIPPDKGTHEQKQQDTNPKELSIPDIILKNPTFDEKDMDLSVRISFENNSETEKADNKVKIRKKDSNPVSSELHKRTKDTHIGGNTFTQNMTWEEYREKYFRISEIHYSNVIKTSQYDALGTFVSISIETTGLNFTSSSIIAVAAIKYKNWKKTDKYFSYVKPRTSIRKDTKASYVNYISNETVKDAPTFEEITPALQEFIGKHNIVGHNLRFHITFLYTRGLDVLSSKRKYYDTLSLSKWAYNERKMVHTPDKYSLDELCGYLYISSAEKERAMMQAEKAAILFRKTCQEKTR